VAEDVPTRTDRLFRPGAHALIGVVHLPRLLDPAGPISIPSLVARAVTDGTAYRDAGFDALIVENYGDAPFVKTGNPPATIAAVTLIADAVRQATTLPIGINLLRNDAVAALGVCHAASGAFVRVNVLTGVAVTDQGLIEGDAHAVQAARRSLGRHGGDDRIRIMADLDVKHAAPLVARPLDVIAEEAVMRGGADGLLVTGAATGRPADLDHVRLVRTAMPGVPVWVASGVTAATVAETLEHADGAIVGTAAKQDGVTHAPVDPERAVAIARAAGKA
jgi:hypothetical protein